LYPAVNLLDGKGFYLAAPIGQLPAPRGIMRVCGKMEGVGGKASDKDFLSSFEIIDYKKY
jgi:hypothetical protein